jgi:hypothetical protein
MGFFEDSGGPIAASVRARVQIARRDRQRAEQAGPILDAPATTWITPSAACKRPCTSISRARGTCPASASSARRRSPGEDALPVRAMAPDLRAQRGHVRPRRRRHELSLAQPCVADRPGPPRRPG